MLRRYREIIIFIVIVTIAAILSTSIYQAGRSFQRASSILLERDIPRLNAITILYSEVTLLISSYHSSSNRNHSSFDLINSLVAANINNLKGIVNLQDIQREFWRIEKIDNLNSILLALERIQAKLKAIQHDLTAELSVHRHQSVQQAISLSSKIELYTVILFVIGVSLAFINLNRSNAEH